MSPITNISTAEWLSLGARLVGLVFIWSGGIKAVAPHTFRSHVESLGVVPRSIIGIAVSATAGLEVGLGVALVLGLAPGLVYPLTVALLIVLSSVSWWGVQSGKATDCGCYGGFVRPSIRQSVGLNALFAGFVIVAWLGGVKPLDYPGWMVWTSAGSAITAAALAQYAQWYNRKNGRLLFDTNPLKIGKRWRHGWADDATRSIDGEVLVAYLGPDCPYCAQWVKMGNAVIQSPSLPRVVGVIAATKEKRETFVRDNGIRFPIVNISDSLMSRLAQAVPTTVLVEAGRIKNTWVGSAPPPEFVDRIKTAFFPDAEQNVSLGVR
jgi:uncharacterized membrane protein YphA (DoxX/SURF4 family)